MYFPPNKAHSIHLWSTGFTADATRDKSTTCSRKSKNLNLSHFSFPQLKFMAFLFLNIDASYEMLVEKGPSYSEMLLFSIQVLFHLVSFHLLIIYLSSTVTEPEKMGKFCISHEQCTCPSFSSPYSSQLTPTQRQTLDTRTDSSDT